MSRQLGGGRRALSAPALHLGGLVLIAVLGLVLVLAGFFEWLGLPARLNGLWFVLFLQPLLLALTTVGRVRRAERLERRAQDVAAQHGPAIVPGSAARARAAREAAAERRRSRGLMRSTAPEELPYAFDYALGQLQVLADKLAEERGRPLAERLTGATDESLDGVAGHLSRSQQTLAAGHVDLAEMHFDRITAIVLHVWRYDAALSSDLLAARRDFFGNS